MRILLVEDDAALCGVMLRSLSDAGHRVDVASAIDDARHWWRVQLYDAVLLDLHLPDGRGEELLELDVATTFVVLTGNRSGASRLSHGLGHRFLTLEKPLDVEKFLSTLDSVLTVPVARRPPRGLIPGPR